MQINYSEIARETGRSRQHIRECLRGNRKPGADLKRELMSLGLFGGRCRAKA